MQRMHRSRRARLAAALVGAAVALSACSATPTPESTLASADTSTLLAGEFETVAGTTFDLGSLEGQDTVLWFWAPW